MPEVREVHQAKSSVENDYLNRPGVQGVGVGYKIVDGVKTDEVAIVVFVEEKKDVPKAQMIPPQVDGVKTDVIERRIVLHPMRIRVEEIEAKADSTTYDPVKGGISIGPCRSIGGYVYTGTLGAIVTDNNSGDVMLLSNLHVMCVDDGWSAGDTMAQPSRVDTGSCPGSTVGQLQRASLGGQVDCAVSSLSGRGHACEIVDIGPVNGTAAATLGMAVRKRGRTTGLTYGTVDTIALTVSVDYEDGLGTVTLTNQIGIDVDSAQSTQFGTNGDSGSVVVDGSANVVGLYFAGSEDGSYGVANPIQAVLGAMNVSLCVQKRKEKLEVKENFKIEKPEFKEAKREKAEIKESFKIEKPEFKEFKREKAEIKELKREKHEIKEFKIEKFENKEFLNEKYDIEKPDETIPIDPTFPIQPGGPGLGGSLAERLARLEAILTPQAVTPSGQDCIDFQSAMVGSGPNPRVSRGTTFLVREYTGSPAANTRVVTWGAFSGLDCGYSLEISLTAPCTSVDLTLVHFSQPATVTAYHQNNQVGTASMSGPQNIAETLTISGAAIDRVIVTAPQNETLLLRFCCATKGSQFEKPVQIEKPILKEIKNEKREKREKLEKPEKPEKPEKLEIKEGKREKPEHKEFKDAKYEKREKPEKHEIKEVKREKLEFEKPNLEKPDENFPIDPTFPIQPGQPGPGGSIEERLARLEAALGSARHFIDPGLRPDLSTGALTHESDLSPTDLETLRQQLQQQEREAKLFTDTGHSQY